MEERLEITDEEYTNDSSEETCCEQADTIPTPTQENSLGTVTVKFNKETRTLSADEAAVLAQKGMKYDIISQDLARLKSLASSHGKNISDYLTDIENEYAAARKKILLERVGGNDEVAEQIIALENARGESPAGLEELYNEFPQIKSEEDIPDEVRQAVEQKGGNFFDEYLRYLYRQQKNIADATLKAQQSKQMSVGSQSRYIGDGASNTSLEFIRGLWS